MKTIFWLTIFVVPVVSSAAKDEAIETRATRLFQQLDVDNNHVLRAEELLAYEMKHHPDWSDPDFQALPKFAELVRAKAMKAVIEDFTFYSMNPSAQEVSVSLDAFTLYLQNEDPKIVVPKPNVEPPSLPAGHEFIVAKEFHLKKSSTSVKDEKQPAQIGWTAQTGKKPNYTMDAALSYTLEIATPKGLFLGQQVDTIQFVPTAEAHTTGDSSSDNNSISLKPMFWAVLSPAPPDPDVVSPSKRNPKDERPSISSQFVSISPDYERDFKKETETLGIDFLYSPTIDPWRVGRVISLGSKEDQYFPTFLWRPYLGFQYGHIYKSDNTDAFGTEHAYQRFLIKVHTELSFSSRFFLTCDYYHTSFVSGAKQDFDYVELSPTYLLAEVKNKATGWSSAYTFGLTLKSGRNAPKFISTKSLNAWLGLQF